jgi:hypothetical protein
MRVAVITLTRDRLDYTKHCFASLERNAGCDYDHYVLDNASEDGTGEWLLDWLTTGAVCISDENIGVCRGANQILEFLEPDEYDVIVRFDNDCEVTQKDTLKTVAGLCDEYGAILAPRVLGLNNPPPTLATVAMGGHYVDTTAILGGIFMAIPAFVFTEHEYRFDETMPKYAGDEKIVPFWRSLGGVCGYVRDVSVNHYQTSEGQKTTYPEYQARKEAEIALGSATEAAA